jgi:hypothetical protein
VIAWFVMLSACAQVAPVPLSAEIDDENTVELRSGTYVVFEDEAAATAGWFDALNDATGGRLRPTTAARYRENDFAIYAGVTATHPSFRERRQRRWLDEQTPAGPGGFRLSIDRRGVLLAGTDDAGVRNGVTTLIGLLRDGATLPHAQIRDEAAFAIRATQLDSRPDTLSIRALAAAKCNMAIIRSDDFWRLDDQTAGAWRDTFAALRRAGIEPVPLIDPIGDAAPLLTRAPQAAVAQLAIDQLTLADDQWTNLTHPNVIETESLPIRVRLDNTNFQAGIDYVIAPGQTVYPYTDRNEAWSIRRVGGGAIPGDRTIDVIYAYAALNTQTASPLAPEYAAAVEEAVGTVMRTLEPQFIHLGHGAPSPMTNDARASEQHTDDGLFAMSLRTALNAADGARPILYAGVFRDSSAALPSGAILDASASRTPPPITGTAEMDLAWTNQSKANVLLNPPGDFMKAASYLEAATRAPNVAGVIANSPEVIAMAWGPGRISLPWPNVLNDYFGARLWDPGDVEAFQAIVQHVNARTVRGVSPETQLSDFQSWFRQNRDRLPSETAAFVEGHFTRVVEWVRLEAEHRRGDGRTTLRDLLDLVQRHADAIPEYPEERRSTIVHTIDSAGRFVPSNILFGTPVLPYRPIDLPGAFTVLEVPVRPEFIDQSGSTTAKFELLESPGPIVRIDFDTLEPRRMAVERKTTGEAFETVESWPNANSRALDPPLLLPRPFSASTFRVTIEAAQPVLRDPRVFALKDQPAAICSQGPTTPVLDGVFREAAWPTEAAVTGFVETTEQRFAAIATTIRLTRTRDAIYFGVYAREPRMDTSVADIATRDGALWTEEAIDLRLTIGNDTFVFAVNPLGTQYDARNGNPAWNGRWQAVTQRFTTGWSAEIAIPFDTLGRTPSRGEDWQFDAVRYRRNVENSTSHWAYRPDTPNPRQPGRIVFN